MRSAADRFALESLRPQLKPWRLHYFTRLGSTNDHAARMRREGRLVAPSIVLASRQTRGRGRGSNRWHSPTGCLTVTFALPIDETRLPHQLPLIAGIAVRRALSQLVDSQVIKLKWPNDLLHDDLKLAGLLCERVARVDLIGLGLNVNIHPREAPASVRDRVTSLQAILGRPIALGEVLVGVASALHALLLHPGTRRDLSQLSNEYRAHDALLNRTITVQPPGEAVIRGECRGIDRHGRLLVTSADGTTHRLVSGHIEAR